MADNTSQNCENLLKQVDASNRGEWSEDLAAVTLMERNLERWEKSGKAAVDENFNKFLKNHNSRGFLRDHFNSLDGLSRNKYDFFVEAVIKESEFVLSQKYSMLPGTKTDAVERAKKLIQIKTKKLTHKLLKRLSEVLSSTSESKLEISKEFEAYVSALEALYNQNYKPKSCKSAERWFRKHH